MLGTWRIGLLASLAEKKINLRHVRYVRHVRNVRHLRQEKQIRQVRQVKLVGNTCRKLLYTLVKFVLN